jgi:hypothetical protein
MFTKRIEHPYYMNVNSNIIWERTRSGIWVPSYASEQTSAMCDICLMVECTEKSCTRFITRRHHTLQTWHESFSPVASSRLVGNTLLWGICSHIWHVLTEKLPVLCPKKFLTWCIFLNIVTMWANTTAAANATCCWCAACSWLERWWWVY